MSCWSFVLSFYDWGGTACSSVWLHDLSLWSGIGLSEMWVSCSNQSCSSSTLFIYVVLLSLTKYLDWRTSTPLYRVSWSKSLFSMLSSEFISDMISLLISSEGEAMAKSSTWRRKRMSTFLYLESYKTVILCFRKSIILESPQRLIKKSLRIIEFLQIFF